MIAIILNEPDAAQFLEQLKQTALALISTVTAVEVRMVTYGKLGHRGVVLLDDLLATTVFEIIAPGPSQMSAAFNAFVAFGKGSGHRAGLNFGDIFSYALAKTKNLPLLFKGEDFSHTAIASAL